MASVVSFAVLRARCCSRERLCSHYDFVGRVVVLIVSWCAHLACMVVIVLRYVWLYLRVGVLAGVCHCMLRCLICLVLKLLWVYARGCVLMVLVCTSVEGCSSRPS